MKKQLLTLILTVMVALNTTAFAQPSPDTISITKEATPAIRETKCLFNASKISKTVKTSKSSKASKSWTGKASRRAKTATTAALVAKHPLCGMEQSLATFVFVVNRGEVFSINARGELTELSLSGFTTDALPVGNEATMNESACLNTVTIAGAATLNDYMPQPATSVTASLRLRPLTAPRGLTLALTIDGVPLRVLLPFDSGACRWQGGYTYRYVLTLNGGALQVTGMTVTPTVQKQ